MACWPRGRVSDFGGVGDEYELKEVLGKGSFGEVRRALHVSTGAEVAIKFIPTPATVSTPEEREAWSERIGRRAETWRRCQTPYVVKVLEAFAPSTDTGSWRIMLELCSGCDLSAILPRIGKLDAKSLQTVSAQLATAVYHLHKQGFVHRDLKPANTMVMGGKLCGVSTSIKVIDFGPARLPKQPRGALSGLLSGTRAGGAASMAYAAPEARAAAIATEGADVTSACDAFSVGATMRHCATGVGPEEDIDAKVSGLNRASRMLGTLVGRPVPDYRLMQAVPEDVRSLIEALQQTEPESRMSITQLCETTYIAQAAGVVGNPFTLRKTNLTNFLAEGNSVARARGQARSGDANGGTPTSDAPTAAPPAVEVAVTL